MSIESEFFGAWAVININDKWELEHQHSFQVFPLLSDDRESAIAEGMKLAKELDGGE